MANPYRRNFTLKAAHLFARMCGCEIKFCWTNSPPKTRRERRALPEGATNGELWAHVVYVISCHEYERHEVKELLVKFWSGTMPCRDITVLAKYVEFMDG